MTDLRRAQQDLSQQHSQDLSRVRHLGETLAVPLTWEQLFHGLVNIIWESLNLQVLGLEFQGGRKELTLEAYRRQPGLQEEAVAGFKVWLKRRFHLAVGYETPLSLLFLDLDSFKVINDTLGHSQGDAALKTLADYLQGALRHADVICRYGGEEFVVLLSKTPLDQAMLLAERLRRKISEIVIPLPERDLRLTVSIGVARLSPGMDGEALVNAADAAMYRAKQAEKNLVCGPESCLLT